MHGREIFVDKRPFFDDKTEFILVLTVQLLSPPSTFIHGHTNKKGGTQRHRLH